MQTKLNLPPAFVSPAELAGMPDDTPVLLALSGGADSRALLHMLSGLSHQRGFLLVAAHVDHGIRGEESRRDRAFCEQLAKQYEIELFITEADVPQMAKESGKGLEEMAREVRYRAFERLMREKNIPLLVTAHHANDQAETVLFRLCRGTGMAGLAGISPARHFANGFLTRPLLRVSREEILSYCKENGLDYVTDSTNGDISYTRNRIRARLLPEMEQMFSGVTQRLVAMSDSLREDEALLSELAEDLLKKALAPEGLLLDVLQSAPMPLCRRVIAKWGREQTGSVLERVHLDAIEKLLCADSMGEVALFGDRVAVSEFGILKICKRAELHLNPFELPFFENGEMVLPSGIRIVAENQENGTKINKLSTHSCLNSSAVSVIINDGFFWRSRREGDLLLMGGMHRKLRRLYRGVGIPPRWRDAIPLLCDAKGIVWAPFIGVRDGLLESGDVCRLCVKLPLTVQPERVAKKQI